MQAYALIKDRSFGHTSAYDSNFLEKICIDVDFLAVWKTVGWEDVPLVWEEGSCLLTIQFLCSLKEVENGISFMFLKKEFYLPWRDLSSLLGFHKRCSLDLNASLCHFNRHKFWGEILGQAVVGKFQSRNMDIQNPTLRFMHRWVAMTLFPRDDVRIVRNDELRILYGMVKKIKIAPVMPMIKQGLENFKLS